MSLLLLINLKQKKIEETKFDMSDSMQLHSHRKKLWDDDTDDEV